MHDKAWKDFDTATELKMAGIDYCKKLNRLKQEIMHGPTHDLTESFRSTAPTSILCKMR